MVSFASSKPFCYFGGRGSQDPKGNASSKEVWAKTRLNAGVIDIFRYSANPMLYSPLHYLIFKPDSMYNGSGISDMNNTTPAPDHLR